MSIKYIISFCIAFCAQITILQACQICVPYPTKSMADWILEAKTVVLAKESATRPFTFEAHTALKGYIPSPDGIDIILNRSLHQILDADREKNVVLIFGGEEGEEKWLPVGMGEHEIEALTRNILKNSSAWENDPKKRLDFFVGLIRHENMTIRELAYLEIGSAPYSDIRELQGVLPRNEIYDFIQNFRYIEWHALHILLLGLSDDPRDTEFIRNAFRGAARFGTHTRLAAWTTAYIEMNPIEAMRAISANYFSDPLRREKELHSVIQAISVHGQESNTKMRDQFVKEYETLLTYHPDMAALVVKDLMVWKRYELEDQVREILQSSTTTQYNLSALMLRNYVEAAENANEQSSTPD